MPIDHRTLCSLNTGIVLCLDPHCTFLIVWSKVYPELCWWLYLISLNQGWHSIKVKTPLSFTSTCIPLLEEETVIEKQVEFRSQICFSLSHRTARWWSRTPTCWRPPQNTRTVMHPRLPVLPALPSPDCTWRVRRINRSKLEHPMAGEGSLRSLFRLRRSKMEQQ